MTISSQARFFNKALVNTQAATDKQESITPTPYQDEIKKIELRIAEKEQELATLNPNIGNYGRSAKYLRSDISKLKSRLETARFYQDSAQTGRGSINDVRLALLGKTPNTISEYDAIREFGTEGKTKKAMYDPIKEEVNQEHKGQTKEPWAVTKSIQQYVTINGKTMPVSDSLAQKIRQDQSLTPGNQLFRSDQYPSIFRQQLAGVTVNPYTGTTETSNSNIARLTLMGKSYNPYTGQTTDLPAPPTFLQREITYGKSMSERLNTRLKTEPTIGPIVSGVTGFAGKISQSFDYYAQKMEARVDQTPNILGAKTGVRTTAALLGAGSGAYGYVSEKPAQTATFFIGGAALKSVVRTPKVVAILKSGVGKWGLRGLGAAYVGGVGINVATTPTYAAKGRIFGEETVKMGAFTAGMRTDIPRTISYGNRLLTPSLAAELRDLPSTQIKVRAVQGFDIGFAGKNQVGADVLHGRLRPLYSKSFFINNAEFANQPSNYRFVLQGERWGVMANRYATQSNLPASGAVSFRQKINTWGTMTAENLEKGFNGYTYTRVRPSNLPPLQRAVTGGAGRLYFEPIDLSNGRELALRGFGGGSKRPTVERIPYFQKLLEFRPQLEYKPLATTRRFDYHGMPLEVIKVQFKPSSSIKIIQPSTVVVGGSGGTVLLQRTAPKEEIKLNLKTQVKNIPAIKPKYELGVKTEPPKNAFAKLTSVSLSKGRFTIPTREKSHLQTALNNRFRTKQQVGTKFRQQPSSNTRIKPITVPKVAVAAKTSVTAIQLPKITPKTIQKTITTPKITQTPRLTTITPPEIPFPRPKTPPPTIKVPPLGLPFGGGGRGRGGFGEWGHQPKGYKPSIYAIAANVRGKKPSRGELKTGLGVRPVIRSGRKRRY